MPPLYPANQQRAITEIKPCQGGGSFGGEAAGGLPTTKAGDGDQNRLGWYRVLAVPFYAEVSTTLHGVQSTFFCRCRPGHATELVLDENQRNRVRNLCFFELQYHCSRHFVEKKQIWTRT